MSAVRRLSIDIETYSPISLKKAGVYKYSEAVEVLLVAWAWNEEPVAVWDMTAGEHTLDDVAALFAEADEAIAFNSNFERTVFRAVGIEVPASKFIDPMVLALQHSLPGKLETLCDVLRVPRDLTKDKRGKKLIDLFSKPLAKNRKLRRATRETHPVEWGEFIEYARSDVDAMRAVLARLPRWNDTPSERELWLIDQASGDLGVAIDLELAQSAMRAFERVGRSLAATTAELTDGAVGSTTQRDRLREHLRDAFGFDMPDLTKGTVERLVEDTNTPEEVRAILAVRLQASATSPAKYQVLLDATGSDGRLRGTIQFCGASRTGRSSGRLFQPQNLPRPSMKYPRIEAGIEAMKLDCEDLLFDNVSELCVNAVRGALVAPPGKKLVVSDLSNIEGRVLAWLAGEEWKLQAFRDFDAGIGFDLYILAYARSYNLDPQLVLEDKKAGGNWRQIGKVMELALGYQGAVGAFVTMAANYGVNLPEDKVIEIVKAWRAAHPRIRNLWYALESAAKSAIENPGSQFVVNKLALDYRTDAFGHNWLRMKLPSGRYLCYFGAQLETHTCPKCDGAGTVLFEFEGVEKRLGCPECGGSGKVGDGRITYEGVHQKTRQWCKIDTYGGKFCIASGTPVLTERGWVPIEKVQREDRVWDGVEWVSHEGLAHNGVMEVICAHGVWMTPDHKVLTTKGWVDASQSERFDRASCWLPDGPEIRREQRQEIFVADGVRLRDDGGYARDRIYKTSETRDNRILRVQTGVDRILETEEARDVSASGVLDVAQHERQMPPTHAPCLGQLRRSWNSGLRTVAKIFHELLRGHVAVVGGGPDARPDRQQRRVFQSELPVGYTETPRPEHAGEPHRQHALGRDHGGGAIRKDRDRGYNTSVPPLGWRDVASLGDTPRFQSEVLDLINCGPRKRFVVRGCDGLPLIVHNCEQGTQGTARDVFMGGLKRAWKAGYYLVIPVHDEAVTEVPDDPQYTAEELSRLLATQEYWNMGLPLAAAGDEMHRYHKTD